MGLEDAEQPSVGIGHERGKGLCGEQPECSSVGAQTGYRPFPGSTVSSPVAGSLLPSGKTGSSAASVPAIVSGSVMSVFL